MLATTIAAEIAINKTVLLFKDFEFTLISFLIYKIDCIFKLEGLFDPYNQPVF
ncbi:adenylate cyclase, family 3 [Lactiplantibacillus plantarum]|uniref:Uncharacterized protein n=1 Tax=Lactiplantibacillus pentosus DSM 20314 TaxID=1423791 RepID=A0A837R7K5_LACPE|nr:hypothetical protein FD24_GL000955 [Lactiplantibacillus pentosus DSM 20314]BBM22499.1 adenylate cyclase, family 3 [Lactiplantibacillus plantarum]